jgi:ribonuclease-3
VHPSEKLMLSLQEALPAIEDRLGYHFQDKTILTQAFVHRSFLNECQFPDLIANERLEFLGDAVLNLYVSSFLFARFPERGEGLLSKQKAQAVCQTSCAVMMEQLDLISYLLVGKGEQTLLSKSRPSLGSDLFEAIVGAVYVDGGWHAAERFLSLHFDAHFSAMSETVPSNAKAELQEFLAKQGKGLPEYKLADMSGPPHERIFIVSVFVEGHEMGRASGTTKREAEQQAAAQALFTFNPI